jgi:hypothetical protein
MSFGILARPRLGLGSWTSTIPGECWDQPGFKDCNAIQYKAAQTVCISQNNNTDACIGALADQYSMNACGCKKKTTTKKPVVTSVTPVTPDEGFETEPTIFGLSMKSVATIALVGVGLYLATSSKKG